MKIQGSNSTNLNVYKNQLQRQANLKKNEEKNDQLNISNEAKQLQEMKKTNSKRSAYVDSIKREVNTGKYEVNVERTSQRMIDFWTKRS